MIKRTLASLLLIGSGVAQASGFDISLNDEAASLVYLQNDADFGENGTDIGYGVFFNNSDDFILNANFMVVGEPAGADHPWQFGIGAKAYLGKYDVSDLDLGSIAIGGQIRYTIPASVPMAATLEGHYAPEITSFGDTEKLAEISFRYEFEVVETARVFVGYRLLEADFDSLDGIEFDDQAHVGIRITFN